MYLSILQRAHSNPRHMCVHYKVSTKVTSRGGKEAQWAKTEAGVSEFAKVIAETMIEKNTFRKQI